MDRYAVVGNPVSHSLSPRIHAAFARATGEAVEYHTLLAPVDAFAATVEAFFAAGGAGLNVTVPFKEQAAAWVTECTADAAAAGAVNTIVADAGRFIGHNTDGGGLIRDLTGNCGEAVAGKRLLVLGAGGAARGVIRPLVAQGPAALTIANRTASRAAALARSLAAARPAVRGLGLEDVTGTFDVVINATSAGLGPGGAPVAVAPRVLEGAFCYDMMYAEPGTGSQTPFCRMAAAHGARRTQDGLGMLVEQAALAFALWRRVVPPTTGVLELLRSGRVS